MSDPNSTHTTPAAPQRLSDEQIERAARLGCGGDNTRWSFSDEGLRRTIESAVFASMAAPTPAGAPAVKDEREADVDVDLPQRVIDQLVADSGFTYIEPEEHHVYSLAQAVKREVLARLPRASLGATPAAPSDARDARIKELEELLLDATHALTDYNAQWAQTVAKAIDAALSPSPREQQEGTSRPIGPDWRPADRALQRAEDGYPDA